MSQRAPEHPTTEVLDLAHPTAADVLASVTQNRERIAQILRGEIDGFIDINGGCGPTVDEHPEIIAEAKTIQSHNNSESTHIAAYRSCVYKPRTNPDDWHGEETTDPEEAYKLQQQLAEVGIPVAMEVAHDYHIGRYGNFLSFGWTGSRNAGVTTLLDRLGKQDVRLPLGVKNNLYGNIGEAIEHTERINTLRRSHAERLGVVAAPAVVVYRGGKNAQTPEKWAKGYIEAYERTDGLLIVDTAHGAEMAHHPEGSFEKSVEGQVAALDHLVELACRGYVPIGKLSEASSTQGRTDPNMPLQPSLEVGKQLHAIKMQAN